MGEIEDRFAITDHRKHLFTGFKKGVDILYGAGCRYILLDGSFITEKTAPKDYDACWDPVGVDIKKLDPVFLDFSNRREKQKKHFYGEYFPINSKADGARFFDDFFQVDKYTGKPKGIIGLSF
jgi:hypothetical protein